MKTTPLLMFWKQPKQEIDEAQQAKYNRLKAQMDEMKASKPLFGFGVRSMSEKMWRVKMRKNPDGSKTLISKELVDVETSEQEE